MQIVDGKIDHPEVRIESTSRCNAHCITCPREKMTRAKMDMPMDHFISLVDQVKDLGAQMVSVFGYGEPLVDPDIVDRIQYCTDSGLDTFITTNASLLDVEMATRLVKAGLTHIRISVHAIKSKDYERVHRKLNAATTFRNIQNFVAVNRKRCKIHITCMPLSGETVDAFRARWEESADFLEVWQPHNWAGGRKFRQSNNFERVKCRRALTGPVQILADGSMVLCCFDTDGQLVIGNTHDHCIEDILTSSPELMDYRRRHDTGDLAGLLCENCDQRFRYDESPLLYSNEQNDKKLNKTSITKFDLERKVTNGLCTNRKIRLSDPGRPGGGVCVYPDNHG
jgi:organic radical activating enzyme